MLGHCAGFETCPHPICQMAMSSNGQESGPSSRQSEFDSPHRYSRCSPNLGHFMRYGDQRCECGEVETFASRVLPRSAQERAHERCHDLVCNGNRDFAVGVPGHGCSCLTRERRERLPGPQPEPAPAAQALDDDEPLHSGDDERVDLMTSILTSLEEMRVDPLGDITAEDILLDCEQLDPLIVATVKRERAQTHAALSLARSLPDLILADLRHTWGNTNVAVVKHWRDEVLKLAAPAPAPQEKP